MNPRLKAIGLSIVAGFCVALCSPHAQADADNVSGLIDVSIYAGNSDYLQFTVHRPKIPQLYVMREVLCRVNLVKASGLHAPKSFQLTSVEPHYFDFEPTDAVIHFPVGEPSVHSVTAIVCMANGVYPQFRISGMGKAPAAPAIEITGLAASASGSPGEPPLQLQVEDGLLVSSTTARQENPNEWDISRTHFEEILNQLPDKTLAEPKSTTLVKHFQEQLSFAPKSAVTEGPVHVKVLGSIPNS
jgi:hypothetical protein